MSQIWISKLVTVTVTLTSVTWYRTNKGRERSLEEKHFKYPIRIESISCIITSCALTLCRYSQYFCIMRPRPPDKFNTIVHKTEYTSWLYLIIQGSDVQTLSNLTVALPGWLLLQQSLISQLHKLIHRTASWLKPPVYHSPLARETTSEVGVPWIISTIAPCITLFSIFMFSHTHILV